jgi:hypothetical protein
VWIDAEASQIRGALLLRVDADGSTGDARPLTESLLVRRYQEWGVYPGPWLWGERLKILYVIDGVIKPVRAGSFALGMLTDILLDPSYAWWVDFEVTVAHRAPATFRPPLETLDPGPYGVRYTQFRFDQPGFDLNEYDQVWLFGFQPGNDGGPDANIELPENTPLRDTELQILAEWMDAGGGVFATGDHAYLGASMCSRVPRVRTMRKWTHAQGVPPISGPLRLDTNQPTGLVERINLSYMDFDHQGDAVPQPIEVVLEPLWTRVPWLRFYAPHPILCTRAGIIETFPDHPHEGEVIADEDVRLDEPLLIPGYASVEYPGGKGRPTPKVIAYGRTTHRQWNRIKYLVHPRRFGLIGTYDGDSVGIGRVVVDSTWHHWMSENLVGFEADNPEMMTLMASYYRNVALWLATPTQRANMAAAAVWGVLLGASPMEFPPTASIWDLGERARDVIGRTASQCTIREWIDLWFDFAVFREFEPPDPCLNCPPWELFEKATLGGIAKQMLEVAFPIQKQMSIGERPSPDPEAIAAAAMEGARLGHRELMRALEANAAANDELRRAAAQGSRETVVEAPDLGVMTVRVLVEDVRFVDAFDPALSDGALTLELGLEVDGETIAGTRHELTEIPEHGPRGAVARLEADLGQVTVWRGSELSVVVTSADAPSHEQPHATRGRLTLTGDPRGWLGVHQTPVKSQDRWRLRVRIE